MNNILKYIIFSVLTAIVLIPWSLNVAYAYETAPRISDREIIESLVELKQGQKNMHQSFNQRFEDMNQRFEDMNQRFDVKILDEVFEFFDRIEDKAVEKILFNIRKSRNVIDKELFTKLENEIWEFRTLFNKKKYRVLAFWDKTGNSETLVVGTNGFIKKTQKNPKKEIEKAKRIRTEYFNSKK